MQSSENQDQSNRRWQQYYNAVSGRPPRETLLAALEKFEQESATFHPSFAVDLGCGEGRDTVELLRRGWRVLAIDAEPVAIARLQNREDLVNAELLSTQIARFETAILPAANFINASFCLPFCPPESFPELWEKITRSLVPGGRFAGHLFGDRDSWAENPTHTHHSRSQVETLLQPFAVEMFEEEEHPGKTAIGEEKYWHLFHIVARKR